MGKTTKWQSSWDNEADENGDLFGDYLIKQDEEYVKCRQVILYFSLYSMSNLLHPVPYYGLMQGSSTPKGQGLKWIKYKENVNVVCVER